MSNLERLITSTRDLITAILLHPGVCPDATGVSFRYRTDGAEVAFVHVHGRCVPLADLPGAERARAHVETLMRLSAERYLRLGPASEATHLARAAYAQATEVVRSHPALTLKELREEVLSHLPFTAEEVHAVLGREGLLRTVQRARTA